MEEDTDANPYLDRVFARASLAERELHAHAEFVAQAVVPAAVAFAEADHRYTLGSHVDNLDQTLYEMMELCRHHRAQEPGPMNVMEAAVSALRDEAEAHLLAERPDLAAAQSEEVRHLAEGRKILLRFSEAGHSMRQNARLYRCERSRRSSSTFARMTSTARPQP